VKLLCYEPFVEQDRLVPTHQINDRHLGRGQESHGRAPGTTAPVAVDKRPLPKVCEPAVVRVEEPGKDLEREELPIVGVAGKLEIKTAHGVLADHRPVL